MELVSLKKRNNLHLFSAYMRIPSTILKSSVILFLQLQCQNINPSLTGIRSDAGWLKPWKIEHIVRKSSLLNLVLLSSWKITVKSFFIINIAHSSGDVHLKTRTYLLLCFSTMYLIIFIYSLCFSKPNSSLIFQFSFLAQYPLIYS